MRNLRLPRRGTVFTTRVIAFMAACVALATTAATAPDRTAATRTPRGVAPVRLTPYRGGLPQPSPGRQTLLKASGYRHDGAQRPPPQPCPRARDGDRVVDWSTFTPSNSLPSRAAVFTDNTLVSYEFAHLFLSVVASLQALGHSVDVLVDLRKPHRSRIQLVDMAACTLCRNTRCTRGRTGRPATAERTPRTRTAHRLATRRRGEVGSAFQYIVNTLFSIGIDHSQSFASVTCRGRALERTRV